MHCLPFEWLRRPKRCIRKGKLKGLTISSQVLLFTATGHGWKKWEGSHVCTFDRFPHPCYGYCYPPKKKKTTSNPTTVPRHHPYQFETLRNCKVTGQCRICHPHSGPHAGTVYNCHFQMADLLIVLHHSRNPYKTQTFSHEENTGCYIIYSKANDLRHYT